jgi:D-methionine transport system ATP-binding protein
MIELIGINKVYSSALQALTDINLNVSAGEIFGVIGQSGAGKSTLIRCINMLEKPTSGKVIVAGKTLTTLSSHQLREERKKIGMIFQNFNLLSSRTVYENITLPLEVSHISKRTAEKIVMPLLELTGLVDKRNYYPCDLSGGQRQRVAIARALINKPKVLLSDEATSALDPHTTHTILKLLQDINKQLGVTILLITHEMEVVKEICHRLAILEHGKIMEQSDVLEFFSNPKSTIAKKFIRSTLQRNLPDIIAQRLTKDQTANCDVLLRLSFVGVVAQEPLITYLIQNFNININILQANIEVIREVIVGVMLIQVSNNKQALSQSIRYLKEKGIFVEVIGYYAK